MTDTDQLSLHQLISELANNRNLDLRGYKTTTLERRIRRRMSEVNPRNYSEYLEKVHQDPHEVDLLLNTILINVTEFFRDPQAWEALHAEVLPGMLRALKPGDPFRAWCAGCASGEEPYSLAILISDFLRDKLADYDIKIYATDIDEEALISARRGEYAAERLRRVRPEWRERYFSGSARLRINREQRRLVIFGRSNLMVDAPISHCQLVICRNLLIYFDTVTQKQILNRMHYALEPGGILFLGKAESKLSESHMFRPQLALAALPAPGQTSGDSWPPSGTPSGSGKPCYGRNHTTTPNASAVSPLRSRHPQIGHHGTGQRRHCGQPQ